MKLLVTLICLVIASIAFPQKHLEFGVFGGLSYYNGDLNPSGHLKTSNNHLAFGLVARKTLNPRWALRANALVGNLSAEDSHSSDPFQQHRNLSFFSRIYEISTVIEFNFQSFNPFNPPSAFKHADYFTPYAFIGLGGFYFDPKANLDGNTYNLQPLQTEGESYSKLGVAIPFGMGIKLRLSERALVSIEYGIRKTFTDYIDDVSSSYPTDPDALSQIARKLSDRSVKQQGAEGSNWGTQRGNSQTTDWYSFVGITLSFNVSTNPDQCHFKQDRL